jgi:hypothetical protein
MADLTEISKLGVGRARTACLLGPTQRRRLPLFHVHFFNRKQAYGGGGQVGFGPLVICVLTHAPEI